MVLKRLYSRLLESKIPIRINYIKKLDFLEVYPSARFEVFRLETIKNSFAAASLLPYNPNRVLIKLDIRLYTPISPSS
jgi:hypothetical protein